jgi:hypothetical protein
MISIMHMLRERERESERKRRERRKRGGKRKKGGERGRERWGRERERRGEMNVCLW